MSMIERAAKAAYERYIEPLRDLEPSWDDLPQSHRDRMIDSQRAAIEAMREPTDSMKVAGGLKCEAIMFEGEGGGVIFNDMGEVFTVMVDEALK